MAYFFVQYWTPLVPILENFPMGDVPDGNLPQGNFSATPSGLPSSNPSQPSFGSQDHHDSLKDQQGFPVQSSPQAQLPFHSHLQQQYYPQYQARQNVQPPAHANMSYPQASTRETAFNMASMGNALPDGNFAQGYTQQSSQRFPGRSSTSPGAYQLPQQSPQFLLQPSMTPTAAPSFPVQYSQQYQGTFVHPQQSPGQHTGVNPQFFPNQNFMVQAQQQAQNFYYPSNQYAPQNHIYSASPLRSYPSQFGGRSALPDGGRQTGSEHLSTTSVDSSGLQGRAGTSACKYLGYQTKSNCTYSVSIQRRWTIDTERTS